MKSLRVFFLVFGITLSGCLVPPVVTMNRLNVGMTKEEVSSLLGQPYRTAASGGVEFFVYELQRGGIRDLYFVKLVNGKVESYGRMGDFDSTKDPTLNLNIKTR